ncbi:MAG: hypothetical protein H6562_25165 [Lewinellaceae bacterium]|nr:hypothetical protein [Lewinella sp.]MCB9282204.1 hypothetical protein [Lewinellaceae bacterium]
MDRTKKLIFFLISFSIMGITSCYYDVEEELYPQNSCVTDGATYQGTVLPIIQNNCYICHSQSAKQGNVVLEGYDNLKFYVDNQKLVGVINHAPGFQQMPQGQPKLGDCNIAKIEAWVQAGAPNN